MHHWLGDKMSLKAEKQIKVSGMRVEKCGEVGRLEERCGEGYSSHLELASITLISLSLSLVCTYSLSLSHSLFLSLTCSDWWLFLPFQRCSLYLSKLTGALVCVCVSGRIPLLDTSGTQVQSPRRPPVPWSTFSAGASSPLCPALLLAPMSLTEDKTSIPGR